MASAAAIAGSSGYASSGAEQLSEARDGQTPSASSTAPASTPAVTCIPGLFEDVGGPICGEVCVDQPETAGGAMQRYTTYHVHGRVGAATFSSRKRYSDFEWLRKTLVNHFPGVRVPPLPKKQRAGRFEEAFIEARRSGLEDFLQRCLRRPHIALESPTLRRFLEASENALEELKKELDKRSIGITCREFKVAYANELRSLNLPADDGRLVVCKTFVERQMVKLKDLGQSFREAAEAHQAVAASVAVAQERLAAVCSDECGILADARASEQPRVELLAAFRQQTELLDDVPMSHYDVLLEAAERELEEAEAMQEALASLEALQQSLQDSKKKIDSSLSQQAKLSEGETPSSFGKLLKNLGQKDRDTQLEQLRIDFEQKSEESILLEEFYSAARTIAIGLEIDSFLSNNIELHRAAKVSFAQRTRDTSQRLLAIWSGIEPRNDKSKLGAELP